MNRFIIQQRKNLSAWEFVVAENTLDDAIVKVNSWDTYEKYSYRVKDRETDVVYYTRLIPHEIEVNLGSNTWLKDLFADYGIEESVWKVAVVVQLDSEIY